MRQNDDWPALVPELACSDLHASLAFYCDLLGFSVRFQREGFAYLELGRAHLMLEVDAGAWKTAERQLPYGRGINLQIEIADAPALARRLAATQTALFLPLQTRWYRQNDIEHGQTEFLVQDPDGYLLRFAQPLGERRASAG